MYMLFQKELNDRNTNPPVLNAAKQNCTKELVLLSSEIFDPLWKSKSNVNISSYL